MVLRNAVSSSAFIYGSSILRETCMSYVGALTYELYCCGCCTSPTVAASDCLTTIHCHVAAGDCLTNRRFCDANQVYLRYCDGNRSAAPIESLLETVRVIQTAGPTQYAATLPGVTQCWCDSVLKLLHQQHRVAPALSRTSAEWYTESHQH